MARGITIRGALADGIARAQLLITSQIRLNSARVALLFPCLNTSLVNGLAIAVTSLVVAFEPVDQNFALSAHKSVILVRPRGLVT